MSITFNGTNSEIFLDADLIGGGVNEAVFCWIRPRGASLTGNTVPVGFGRTGGSPTELSIITIGGASVRAQAGNDSVAVFATASSTLSDVWIPVMARFVSTADRTIYVAGASGADTAALESLVGGAFNRLRFGARPYSDTLRFQGDIAEPTIWSGTLPDATDFAALAAGALPETIKAGSIIWHRQFLTHTDLAAGVAGATPTAAGTLATGATHPVSRAPAAATAITLTGPGSGTVGSPSTNFTVGANGTITGTITVTPSDGGDGGTFSPTSVAISAASPNATFTYTAANPGSPTATVNVTNNGGLTNPAGIAYSATVPSATQLVVTVPDAAGLSGFSGVVLSAAAPGSGVTVIATPTAISFNGSGQATLSIAGLGVPVGARRWVSVTNSTGDPAQSPAPVQAQGPVTAS